MASRVTSSLIPLNLNNTDGNEPRNFMIGVPEASSCISLIIKTVRELSPKSLRFHQPSFGVLL